MDLTEQEYRVNLNAECVLIAQMDSAGDVYFYAQDAESRDFYGTDLIQLVANHGKDRNEFGACFEAVNILVKINQWLASIGIDELTDDERESAAEDHYYESKLDCEKEVESWMHN